MHGGKTRRKKGLKVRIRLWTWASSQVKQGFLKKLDWPVNQFPSGCTLSRTSFKRHPKCLVYLACQRKRKKGQTQMREEKASPPVEVTVEHDEKKRVLADKKAAIYWIMSYCTPCVTCGDLQLHKQVVCVELQVECASRSCCCVQNWKRPPSKSQQTWPHLHYNERRGLAPESWKGWGVAVVTGHTPTHFHTERLAWHHWEIRTVTQSDRILLAIPIQLHSVYFASLRGGSRLACRCGAHASPNYNDTVSPRWGNSHHTCLAFCV